MSKILDNKQIIHIATEAVIIIGIIIYFSSKNKKLYSHIEDLSKRLEDQEEIIQKHELIIKQLVQSINTRNTVTKPPLQTKKGKSNINIHTKPKKHNNVHIQVLDEDEEIIENTDDSQDDNDSDLDDEIKEELKELQQDGLKKRK